jgi:hypothetical protein
MIFMKYGETREQYAERTKNYLGLGAKPQTPKQLKVLLDEGLAVDNADGTVRALRGIVKLIESWDSKDISRLPIQEFLKLIKKRNGKDYSMHSIHQEYNNASYGRK